MPFSKPISPRAPALFLLPGMIAGLALAWSFKAQPAVLCMGAALAAGASWWLNRKRTTPALWFLCFMLGTTLAFWAYGHMRFPGKPSAVALSMPEREATLTLDIERTFSSTAAQYTANGIARVQEAGSTSPVQSHDTVYFRLRVPDGAVTSVLPGQHIQATGVLYPIQVAPSENSFEAYLKGVGIHYRFERSSALIQVKAPSAFDRFTLQMNARFQEYLELGAPPNTHLANIYVAMLLGKKNELSESQSKRFKMTGTMHFFAISGLHIGVIATVIAQCLLLLRVPRRYSPWIGLPLLYLYVEITGSAPSAVRAFMMAAFFWASYAITRQRSPLGALAASAIAVLLIAPEQLWSLGFQLSYIVVLSILLFGLPLHEALLQRFSPYKLLPESSWTRGQCAWAWLFDKLLLLFAISFSAWLASAPLSAGLFGFIAPGAILLNMLLVYLAALVITGGVIGLTLATLGLTSLCAFINHSAWVCIALMDRLVQTSIRIPGSILNSEAFPSSISYLCLLGFMSVLFWLHRDRTRFGSAAVLIAPAFVVMMLVVGYAMSHR